ncbi:hypothetical protein V8C86DRAFT_242552 [Haematococcus lacustris]
MKRSLSMHSPRLLPAAYRGTNRTLSGTFGHIWDVALAAVELLLMLLVAQQQNTRMARWDSICPRYSPPGSSLASSLHDCPEMVQHLDLIQHLDLSAPFGATELNGVTQILDRWLSCGTSCGAWWGKVVAALPTTSWALGDYSMTLRVLFLALHLLLLLAAPSWYCGSHARAWLLMLDRLGGYSVNLATLALAPSLRVLWGVPLYYSEARRRAAVLYVALRAMTVARLPARLQVWVGPTECAIVLSIMHQTDCLAYGHSRVSRADVVTAALAVALAPALAAATWRLGHYGAAADDLRAGYRSRAKQQERGSQAKLGKQVQQQQQQRDQAGLRAERERPLLCWTSPRLEQWTPRLGPPPSPHQPLQRPHSLSPPPNSLLLPPLPPPPHSLQTPPHPQLQSHP